MTTPIRVLLVEDNPGDADLTRETLQDSKLHLYFESEGSALELAPIVQMGPAPASSSDSFYFFNRVDPDDMVRFVSYHHPDSPELSVESTGLLAFVRSISSRERSGSND